MKKRLRDFFFALFVILLIAGGTTVKAAQAADYEAVKKSIEQSIGWAIEKDFEAMFRLWADNMFHFWLFSDSLVVGLDNFKKYAEQWKDPDFRGTRFAFKDLRIVFSRSGDVAWYSCFLDDCGSYKGKETCLKDVFQNRRSGEKGRPVDSCADARSLSGRQNTRELCEALLFGPV